MGACKQIGGHVFQPETRFDFDEVQKLKKQLNIQDRNSYWMTYKLTDTTKVTFPPNVGKLNGDAGPEWINDKSQISALYGEVPSGQKVNQWIRSARNRRFKYDMMKINKGKINLTRKGHKSFGAAALCQMDVQKLSIGDPDTCWQPQSDIFNKVEYTGTQVMHFRIFRKITKIRTAQAVDTNAQNGMMSPCTITLFALPTVTTTTTAVIPMEDRMDHGVTLTSLT